MKINWEYFFGETIAGNILIGIAAVYGFLFVFSLGGLCYLIEVLDGTMTLWGWIALNAPGWILVLIRFYQGAINFFKNIKK